MNASVNSNSGMAIFIIFVIAVIVMSIVTFGSVFSIKNGKKQDVVAVENIVSANENLIEEQEEQISDFELAKFNTSIELHKGTTDGYFVKTVLDEVISSNQKNKDKIIVVKYGETDTSNEDEIRNLKKNFEDFTEYEVILKYDEIGFINKVVIEDIQQ